VYRWSVYCCLRDVVPNRPKYVKAETGGDISNTVLISEIFHTFDTQSPTQFLVPPQLLTSGKLTIHVQCTQRGTDAHDALGAAYGPKGYDSVDWQDWQDLYFAIAQSTQLDP
jgi:hypothetical protein